MSARAPARGRGGFTLTEMLIVIVIISILASLTMVGVSMAITSSRVTSTESLILTLQGAVENYRVRWGDYPPTSLGDIRLPVPNDTNNGAESLCACLASKDRGGSLYTGAPERFVNLDHDKASKNLTNWFFGNNSLWEIADYFGRPVVYMHSRDYAKPTAAQTKVILDPDSPLPQVFKPVKAGNIGSFLDPDKFQIVSAGPDGKLGTSDDIQR